MVTEDYIPERGDILWLNFDPQLGHEHKGKRPALVISPKLYNLKTGLGLFCPITSQIKGYPFEVIFQGSSKINGVILSDQVKNLDWKARKAEFIEKALPIVIEEVLEKLLVLISD